MRRAGGKIDWGHLGADVKAYGDKAYDMVGNAEIDALPAPPPPPRAAAGPGPGSAAAPNGTASAAPAGVNPLCLSMFLQANV